MRRHTLALLLGLLFGGVSGPPADAAPVLDIGPLVLPPATLGEPYDAQLTASAGEAPYRFRARKRRRQWVRGLKVARDGRISGTPKKLGTFTFLVRMKDSGKPRTRSVRTVQIEVREATAWQSTGTSGTTPAARWGHAAAIDSTRNRLIAFGGGSGVNWLSDVVALDLATGAWSELAGTASGPIGRWGHSLVIDEQGDRAILFGGASVAPYGDLWAFDLSTQTWSEIQAQNEGPSARRSHLSVYDPATRRMLVFGGFGTTQQNDVWALDLAAAGGPTWSELTVLGTPPSPREFIPGTFDRNRGKLLVLGGSTASGLTDTAFALDLRNPAGPTWSSLTTEGGGPGARSGAVVAADAPRDRVLFFGGEATTGLRGDLWALEFSGVATPRWTLLQTGDGAGGPSPRTSAAGAMDADTAQLFVVFGNDGALRDDAFSITEETAVVPPSYAWTTSDPLGPSARMNHSLVMDPARRRAIVFGGFDGTYVNDAWSLDLSDMAAPSFEALVPSSAAPSLRFAHTAVLDADRERMLVVFGSDGTSGIFEYFNDIWALDLTSPSGVADWSLIDPSGLLPPPRDEHVSVLDRANNRLVIFGGFDDFTVFADVWALDLSVPGNEVWAQMFPTGDAPAGRAGAAAVYDPIGRRMLVHGGGDGSAFLSDLWALDLSSPGEERWERLERPRAPLGRTLHIMALDPSGPGLLLFGGQALSAFSDIQSLPLNGSGPRAWNEITPITGSARALSSSAADIDPETGNVIIHGGLGPERKSEVHILQRR